MIISSRFQRVDNYVHLKLKQKVLQFERRTGQKVLDLGAGNPHLPPSSKTTSILISLLGQAENYQYPGYGAIPELSQSLINYYQNNYRVNLGPDQIMPLLGAKDGINALTLALADSEDEILVPDPGYPAYQSIAKLYGIKPIPYRLSQSNDFKLDIEEVKKKTTNKTKLIWVNFPANPTGQMIDKKSLTELVNWCLKKKIWLLYDNPYSQIYFCQSQPLSVLQIPKAQEIAVEIGSMSKSHCLAGLRIGWVVGNKKVIEALKTVKSQIDSGLSLPLQKLAANLLIKKDKKWHHHLLNNYKSSQKVVEKLLNSLGLKFKIPQAGLYIWAKIPNQFKSSEQYADYLLEKKSILITPGTVFGETGLRHIRVSITQSPELIERYI